MPTDTTREKDIFAVLRPGLRRRLFGFSRELPEGWCESGLEILSFDWAEPWERSGGRSILVRDAKVWLHDLRAKDAEVDFDQLGGQLRVAVKTCGGRGVFAALVSLGFLASLAWAGHGGGTSGGAGYFHVTADVLHLSAASAWLGGLVPLVLLFAELRGSGDSPEADRLCHT